MVDGPGASALAAALNRELAVKLRGIAREVTRQLTRRGLTSSGALRLSDTSAHDGVLPGPSGGTGHEAGAEPPLGNPTSDGQVLSSTTGGVRSWVPPGSVSAEQIQDVVGAFLHAGAGVVVTYDDAANTLTIAASSPVPPPPDTYAYLTDSDGAYVLDADGAYLYEGA